MSPGAPGGRTRAGDSGADKASLRAGLLASRAATAPVAGDRTARALARSAGSRVVACYASGPGEPDTWALIDGLSAAGARVLLPVLRREPDWAWYGGRGKLRPSWRGILEPTTGSLGADALAAAEWIWIPGLAGTPTGLRLGTGGGWYDRALAHCGPQARIGLLLHDGEVRDELPTDPWDRRVDVILTATGSWECPRSGDHAGG